MKTWTWVSALFASGLMVALPACGDGGEPAGDGDGDVAGDGDGDGDGDLAGTGGESMGPVAPFVEGGLGESGDWRGYLFTAAAAGSMIAPAEFLGSEICASGQLGADYEEWAMIGWNIAQEIDETTLDGGAVNAIAPGGTGIEFNIMNRGTSGLRIQIQADDMGDESWCATVPPTGQGVIAWEEFHTQCWTTGGEAYDPSIPLAQIAVQTYAGSETMPTAFDYCVLDLKAAN